MKSKIVIATTLISAFLLSSCDGFNNNALNKNTHKVIFDSNGGSLIEPLQVKHGEKIEKPADPTREGYTFQNWTYNNEEWSFVGYVVTSDMTLLANWTANNYKLTLTNYEQSRGSVSGAGTYEYDSEVTIVATPSTGYSFIGWYDTNDDLVSDEAEYSFTMGFDLRLVVKWNDGNQYSATLNPNGGTVSQTTIDIQYGKSYNLPTPERKGYTFDGWYNGNTKVSNSGSWSYTSNLSLTARWSIINYKINYNLNGGTNNSSNPSTYNITNSVAFKNPTKPGYEFLGWYKNNEQIANIPTGSTGDISIEARWSANKNKLTVTSQDESKGRVSIVSGTGYTDETIIVEATPASNCVFKGWYQGISLVSKQPRYTFVMPTSDYSLSARFLTQTENEDEEEYNKTIGIVPVFNTADNTVTYGLYPQTNVNDASLIFSLNELTTPESNGWYLFNNEYYAKLSATPYISNAVFDNGTAIASGTTYWFKCEPITWNILSENNGEYYLLSSLLLDAHRYDDNSNNYKNSEIRAWLNNEFFNSAFNLDSDYVKTTNVDNSVSSMEFDDDARFACENTQDKVFLPSFNDYKNENYGFVSDGSRECKNTDWARARGASYYYDFFDDSWLYNSDYWTRSPGYNPDYARCVNYKGSIISVKYVFANECNVRPSITLKIDN